MTNTQLQELRWIAYTYGFTRPFVIGRKNWLFSDSVRGVKASANLYSLIETAKANGLEPYAYLRRVFAELPRAETVEAIEALLPGGIGKDQISSG